MVSLRGILFFVNDLTTSTFRAPPLTPDCFTPHAKLLTAPRASCRRCLLPTIFAFDAQDAMTTQEQLYRFAATLDWSAARSACVPHPNTNSSGSSSRKLVNQHDILPSPSLRRPRRQTETQANTEPSTMLFFNISNPPIPTPPSPALPPRLPRSPSPMGWCYRSRL